MENFNNPLLDTTKLQDELTKVRRELSIVHEISNIMRTTLKLDEILYIILTSVTSHMGFGFNRAMLFLVNDSEGVIEGKIGIGPDTGADAYRIWKHIDQQKMDLDDLIDVYNKTGKIPDSQFNRQVGLMKIPLDQKDTSLLNMAVLDGMPLLINSETIHKYAEDIIVKTLRTDELAIVPLKAQDRINGLIVVDNVFTHKPISKDDLRMLIMLANQAGLAIENSRLYEQAVLRSHTDSLTKLWNHGYFQYVMQEELEKAKVLSLPLSLIMIDIDNFKNCNDVLGHQSGDRILERVAKVLKDHSRKMDCVCRYGGEEFAIIMPQADKKEAYNLAERLRQAVENDYAIKKEILPDQKFTISLGIATFPQDGSTKTDIISYVDKALYEAKSSGKNQTRG